MLKKVSGRELPRMIVRIRDKFKCQTCKKKWEKGMRHFDVHHLDGKCGIMSRSYDRVEDIEGLITLCHKCHYSHHQFYGYMQGKQGNNKKRFSRAKAKRLRAEGKTYDEIGSILGVKSSAIYSALNCN